jgi:hypothetical protein
LYEERRGFKVDAQFYSLLNGINKTVELYLPWLFVKVAEHVDIVGAGDGAWFTVVSKNEI